MTKKRYEKIKDAECVRRLSDGACIPADPANMDWQDYLAWEESKKNGDKPSD